MSEQKREQVETKYLWKLSDIYEDERAWEADYVALAEKMKEIPALQKTLTDSAKTLGVALQTMQQMEHTAAKLFVYARMLRDQDNTNAAAQALVMRAMDINVKLSGAVSFVSPTLLSLKKGVLESYILAAQGKPHCKKGNDPKTCTHTKGGCKKCERQTDKQCKELKDYDFMLKELLRGKKYILSEKEEKLLSQTAEMAAAPKDIFSMLNDADLTFGKVKDADGKTVTLTHGKYIVMMQSEDRAVRAKTYTTFYKAFGSHINTLAASYSASVKKDAFYARTRGYGSSLEKSLFSDNVPVALYENLIKTIHENLPKMHKYLDLRKRILGIDELHMYDVYAPLVKNVKSEYSYEKAMKMVMEACGALGEEYVSHLLEAKKDGWIDVFETKGKTSGAYSWGVFGTHPYVLLNHRGDLDSVYTVAHELGHAMHTFYSNENQCEAKAGYEIFVAEVASTVNEILMTRHLLSTLKNADMKRYVLNHYLDQFRTTVIRQTMFAEFEKLTHEAVEGGGALTHESLNEMYGDLNALYHGNEMARDSIIPMEWSRIPHFYNAFYVYKYATGFSCAVKIASDILSGKENAVEDYKKFLSAGGSDHPLELLKIAHVDLAGGEPVAVCMNEFARALDEFEAMA